jgi:uncharacterized delta-60 repeat protein
VSAIRPRSFGAATALAACLFAVALSSSAYAGVAGALDTTFGSAGTGKVTNDLTTRGDFAAAIAVQPDGKIVVAGGAAWDASNPRFGLIRYNSNGTLDTTFGGGDGKVITDFTTREDAAYGVVIQSDLKIVAAGDAGLGSGNSRFAVARYNTDGTLDTTFGGGDGKVMTQFTRRDDPVAGLALQADQKIVVSGGAADNSSNPKFAVARYDPNGSLDDTFSGDGKVTTDITPGRDYANAVVVDAAQNIVAGGLGSPGSTRASFALVRYTSTGARDVTFSGDGKVLTNFTRRDDSVQNLAFQGTNIIAAGIAGSGSADAKFALARYTDTGALDDTFRGDGKVTTNFTSHYDAAFDVAVQSGDNKIVVGGEAAGSGGRFALARYGLNGGLDNTFGGDGKVTTNFTPQFDFAFGLVLQPSDGRILLAGGSGWGTSNPKVALARYLAVG